MRAPGEASSLVDQVDRWLATGLGWRHLLFPAAMRQQFEADTRRERARTAGLISVAGAIVGLLLYPVLLTAVPDMHLQVVLLYMQVAQPFTLLIALIVLLNPPPLVRETLLTLPTLTVGAVLTYLFSHTTTDANELYVVGMLIVLVFACITLQLRFPAAVLGTVVNLSMYAAVVDRMPNLTPSFRHGLIAATVTAGAYILFGNWRIHADQRRLYALMLRERLRRDGLTERNRELDELVRQDALTGLANRRAYDAWLHSHWHAARLNGTPVGLIMIDVDRFKAFNDLNGHPAGDACLQAVAGCLRRESAPTLEYLARLGGEEFALLLPGHTADSCAAIAERLREAVETLGLRHSALGAAGVITISCGTASMLATDGATPAELCAAADAALYRAKQSGRNRVRIAGDPGLPSSLSGRVTQPTRLATVSLAKPD